MSSSQQNQTVTRAHTHTHTHTYTHTHTHTYKEGLQTIKIMAEYVMMSSSYFVRASDMNSLKKTAKEQTVRMRISMT